MTTLTLQYAAHTTKAGYASLQKTLLTTGYLYNLIVQQRNYASSTHRRQYDRRLTGRDITELANSEPEFQGLAQKLLTSVEQDVHRGFSAYLDYLSKRKQGIPAPKRGRPKKKNPHHRRTLTVSEPARQHLTLVNHDHRQMNLYEPLIEWQESHKSRPKGVINIKGLPQIWFEPDDRIPKGEQPREINITRTAKRLYVNLVFDVERKWPEPVLNSIGIDPGTVHSLTTSDGEGTIVHHPDHDDRGLLKVKRRLRRKAQRQRDKALKEGRARWVSQKNRKGQMKRRLRWIGPPSKSYLKTLLRLRKVEQSRSDSLKGWQHRLTTDLVNTYQTICIEDTAIGNLTRSTSGTVENPNKRAAQKRGLNRRILAQSWGQFRRLLEYKCLEAGRNFILVPAAYTSQTCSKCDYVDSKNRRSQSRFVCLSCGYEANADANAAETIRRRGLEILGRVDETPQGTLREPPEPPSGAEKAKRSRVKPGPGRARRTTKLRSNDSKESKQLNFEIVYGLGKSSERNKRSRPVRAAP